MSKHNLKFFAVIILGVLCLSFNNYAQSRTPQMIFSTSDAIQALYWSGNSLELTITVDTNLNNDMPLTWHIYNVNDAILRQTNQLPLYSLSQNLQSHVVDPDDPLPARQFWSPNERFLITGSQFEKKSEVVIIDTATERLMRTSIPATDFLIWNIETAFVYWSINGETAVVVTSAILYQEPTFFYHITNYTDPATRLLITDMQPVEVNERAYSILDIYDVNTKGDQVLLHSIYDTLDPLTRQTFTPLIIWSQANAHQVLLEDWDKPRGMGGIVGAAFESGTDDNFLIVDERGLIRYSLSTGETEILNPDLNSTRFRQAKFSPNGEWLALIEDASQNNVYLFDVRTVLAP